MKNRTSFFLLQVAAAFAAAYVGVLYIAAQEIVPDQTFIAEDGSIKHAFLAPAFIRQAIWGYILLLPVVWAMAGLTRWFVRDSNTKNAKPPAKR